MRYAVIIEKINDTYSAYVPDLPGCAATGTTLEKVQKNLLEAIHFHLDGMRDDGLWIPQPTSTCQYIEA